MSSKDSTVFEDLCDWFYKLKKDEYVTRELIALQISKIRADHKLPDVSIRDRDVDQALTSCRRDMRLRYRMMIYRIMYRGKSGKNESAYKLASPGEMAKLSARAVKRAVLYVDNAVSHVEVIREKGSIQLLQHELRKELEATSGRMKLVSEQGKGFLRTIAEVQRNGGLLTHNREVKYAKAK